MGIRALVIASGPPRAPAARFGEDEHGIVQDCESLRAIDRFVGEQSIAVNRGIEPNGQSRRAPLGFKVRKGVTHLTAESDNVFLADVSHNALGCLGKGYFGKVGELVARRKCCLGIRCTRKQLRFAWTLNRLLDVKMDPTGLFLEAGRRVDQ